MLVRIKNRKLLLFAYNVEGEKSTNLLLSMIEGFYANHSTSIILEEFYYSISDHT